MHSVVDSFVDSGVDSRVDSTVDALRGALVVHRHADEEDEEVEPPHHRHEARQREVLLDVVVGEVAEASHPHVGRDVEPDRVVDLALGWGGGAGCGIEKVACRSSLGWRSSAASVFCPACDARVPETRATAKLISRYYTIMILYY